MAIGTGAAIIGGSLLAGGLGAISADKAADAQREAAQAGISAQEQAAQLGIEEQRRQFDITSSDLERANRQNRLSLELGARRQKAQLDPFAQAGVEAVAQQRALLGLGSPEEQQAAFAAFEQSPGQQFLQERAQKNLVRNAAAIGGLGSGNVRSALVQQGVGFAQQDFGNQFSRLQQLGGAGQAAASEIGQGALSSRGAIGAGEINTAARQGQFGQGAATNISNILGQQGQAAQFGLQQAGQARASGIQGQNQAIQQGLGGIFTGASRAGLFGGGGGGGGTAINPAAFQAGSGLGQFKF